MNEAIRSSQRMTVNDICTYKTTLYTVRSYCTASIQSDK